MGKYRTAFLFLLLFTLKGMAIDTGPRIVKRTELIEVKFDSLALPHQFPMPKFVKYKQANLQFKNSISDKFHIEFLPAGSTEASRYGDQALVWPENAKAVFLYVAELWATFLDIKVPVTVKAVWAGNMDQQVLGHATPISIVTTDDCQYPIALLNQLQSKDLDPEDADIYCAFNSSFSWYKGTDGNTPVNQSDLASVVMHEFCHGLGFVGSMTVDGTMGSWGEGNKLPFPYDLFTQDVAGNKLVDRNNYANPSKALWMALTSGEVYFGGLKAMAANQNDPVALYAPSSWSTGSSYSHLSNSYRETSNALMCYSIGAGQSIHYPGEITLGILQDVGWQISEEDRLSAPVALNATEVTASSFTANWKEVEYADSYKLDVYKYGPIPSPDKKDQNRTIEHIRVISDLTENSYPVIGLDNNTDYAYVVQASNGVYSPSSNRIFVTTDTSTDMAVSTLDNAIQVYGQQGLIKLYIPIPKGQKLSVYDQSGRLLIQRVVNCEIMDLRVESKGVFFVRIDARTFKIVL